MPVFAPQAGVPLSDHFPMVSAKRNHVDGIAAGRIAMPQAPDRCSEPGVMLSNGISTEGSL
jgi:hypothetical protein